MYKTNKNFINEINIKIIFFVILVCFSAAIIINLDYTYLLIFFGIFLFFVIRKPSITMIILIILIVFFGDWLITINIFPPQIMWLQELFATFIFIKAISLKLLNEDKVEFVGEKIIIGLLFVCIISIYINKATLIGSLLFLRLLLRYYLLFLGIINLDLNEKQMKKINNLVLVLVAIQIPVSVIKFFVYGQNERAIGTYAWRGGVLSTVLPLVVIGFCISYFILYKKSFALIGLILGFIIFSILGAKRGFIFFLPLLIVFLSWFLRQNIKNLFKYSLIGGFIFVIAFYLTLSFIPTLSPGEHERTGINPLYSIHFAKEYTLSEKNGVSYGRTASSIKAFQVLAKKGKLNLLFGDGPGRTLKSRFRDFDTREKAILEYRIGYGITGITWLAVNVGYLGGVLFLFFFVLIMRKCIFIFKLDCDSYWRSFELGMVAFSFIMIIILIFYANIIVSDLLAMHYFCFSSFIVIRAKKLSFLLENDNSNHETKEVKY